MASTTSTLDFPITPTPFPAKTRCDTATIKGLETTATSMSFTDKILVTITQEGKLGHWVHVPLNISDTDNLPPAPYSDEPEESEAPKSDLLPMHHLTATTILGGTIPELNIWGQTLATQIASAILTRNPNERRMVVVGLGLDRKMAGGGREEFMECVGLVLGVL